MKTFELTSTSTETFDIPVSSVTAGVRDNPTTEIVGMRAEPMGNAAPTVFGAAVWVSNLTAVPPLHIVRGTVGPLVPGIYKLWVKVGTVVRDIAVIKVTSS